MTRRWRFCNASASSGIFAPPIDHPSIAHYVVIESGTQIILSQGANVGRPSTLYALAHGTHDKITSIKVGGGVCLIGSGELWLPASDIVSALVVESST